MTASLRTIERAVARGKPGPIGLPPMPVWTNDVELSFLDGNGSPYGPPPVSLLGPEGPAGEFQNFETRTRAISSVIAPMLTSIRIQRFAAGYPLAPCVYVQGSSIGPMAFQDAGATWWQLDLSAGAVNPYWFGVKNVGVANDDYAALVLCRDAARTFGRAVLLPDGFDTSFGTTLELAYTSVRWLAASPLCKMTFTGTGRGISFDGDAYNHVGAGAYRCFFGGDWPVILDGTASCTDLFYFNNCNGSDFKVRVRSCSGAQVLGEKAGGTNSGVLTSLTVISSATLDQLNFTVTPQFVAQISDLAASPLLSLIAEGAGAGNNFAVYLVNCIGCYIAPGTVESNSFGGIYVGGGCSRNEITGLDCEFDGTNPSGGPAIYLAGNDNDVHGCSAAATTAGGLVVAGNNNVIEKNNLEGIHILPGATGNWLRKNTCTGTLLDEGTLTTRQDNDGWSDYDGFTPGMSAASGVLGSAVALVGRRNTTGKTVHYKVTGSVSSVGSGSGAILFTGLPIVPTEDTIFFGRDANTGKSLVGILPASSSTLTVKFYDGTFPGASGSALTLTGEIRAA